MWLLGFAQEQMLPDDINSKNWWMAGFGSNKPCTEVLDPLWCRAVALKNDGKCVALASCDLVSLQYDDIIECREKINAEIPGAYDAINICCTHTHAGIDSFGLWSNSDDYVGPDPEWMAIVKNAIVKAVVAAYKDLKEGKLFRSVATPKALIMDIRIPVVIDNRLTRIHFIPADGSKETVIVHFNAHPESLDSGNTLVSSDFAGIARKAVEEKMDSNCVYFNGCVGGMQTVPQFYHVNGDPMTNVENCTTMGNSIAKIVIGMGDSQEVSPDNFYFANSDVWIPLYNEKFVWASQGGLLKGRMQDNEDSPTGMDILTTVGYIEIGDIKLALIPGELFPEVAKGGFLHPRDAANPEAEVETPVFEVMGNDGYNLVLGLANDEVGYILPENDFFVGGDMPYMDDSYDSTGRKHYEETNSLGPKTAKCVINALKDLIQAK